MDQAATAARSGFTHRARAADLYIQAAQVFFQVLNLEKNPSKNDAIKAKLDEVLSM